MGPEERLFRRSLHAAESGVFSAALDVGLAYANGLGVAPDQPQAVRWLSVATNARSRRVAGLAWFGLGQAYLRGTAGVSPDVRRAVRMFRRGAAAGSADCCCHLGFCFLKGDGVRRDARSSFSWFRRGAALGCPQCQFEVANAYAGRGPVKTDVRRAAEWYRRAARKLPWAMRRLSECYRDGLGVRPSQRLARHWLRQARQVECVTAP